MSHCHQEWTGQELDSLWLFWEGQICRGRNGNQEWPGESSWTLSTFHITEMAVRSSLGIGHEKNPNFSFLHVYRESIPSEVLWWVTAGCKGIVVTISTILCFSSLPNPYFVLAFSVKPLRYNMHIKCCSYYLYIAQWDNWNKHKAAILSHQAQRTLQKSGGWKNIGAERWGGLLGNAVFWIWLGCCTMNSQQLYLYTLDLQMIMSIKISNMEKKIQHGVGNGLLRPHHNREVIGNR